MSNVDYQALREAAEAIKVVATPQKLLAFRMKVTPQVVLALLDELDKWQQESSAWQAVAEKQLALAADAEKRIAELSHHLQCAHDFIEHTEAFGDEASNGILCCGDAQWNIDSSKAALASAGSLNGED